MEIMNMAKKYNIGLDCIRIFAMIAVLLVHVTVYFHIPDNISWFLTWGGSGVQFFFVLSGYLATVSYERYTSALSYYKNRVIRVIPGYYTAILLAIIYKAFFADGMPEDVFHLGWSRYFLALNTVLPSSNYYTWNNLYGWWTMSCFIGFYLMVPIILKRVKDFKGSILLLLISLIIAVVWKKLIYSIFLPFDNMDSLDVLCGASPFGTLYQFSIGIITFYILKQSKVRQGLITLGMIQIIGMILEKNQFIWCACCSILIIAFQGMHINYTRKIISTELIKKIGKESFHVYLVHFMSYDMSYKICAELLKLKPSIVYYMLWCLFVFALIIIFCLLLDFAEYIVKHLLVIHTNRL